MQELINTIVEKGVTVVILAYFIFRDNKFMAQLQSTLQTLVDTTNHLKDVIMSLQKGGKEDGN